MEVICTRFQSSGITPEASILLKSFVITGKSIFVPLLINSLSIWSCPDDLPLFRFLIPS
jgi:hypothetical protein